MQMQEKGEEMESDKTDEITVSIWREKNNFIQNGPHLFGGDALLGTSLMLREIWVGPLLRAEGHSLLISADGQGSDTDAGDFTWRYDTYGPKTVPSIFRRVRPRHHLCTCTCICTVYSTEYSVHSTKFIKLKTHLLMFSTLQYYLFGVSTTGDFSLRSK